METPQDSTTSMDETFTEGSNSMTLSDFMGWNLEANDEAKTETPEAPDETV